MSDQLTASGLAALLAEPVPPLLIHVLPPESWESVRIPGSHCACVYETAFLEQAGALCPEKSRPLVVYGAGTPSAADCSEAAFKLREAGYTAVREFPGGLGEWRAAGLPVEGTGGRPAPPSFDGHWTVDTAESIIRWTGRNLFNHHEGTVPLSGGRFEIADGSLLPGGGCRIDLRRIACADLTDPEWNAKLLAHLADRDFFLTDQFPEAVFTLTRAERLPSAPPGHPNCQVEGTLALRGVTAPVSFPALAAVSDEGRLTVQAWLEIDRTRWGVNYGSGKIYAWLGKHLVNDHIGLHLKIHSTRETA